MQPLPFTRWQDVTEHLVKGVKRGQIQWRQKLVISKKCLPEPASFGLIAHIGMPDGQQADFRKTLPGHIGLHVQDYGSYYKVHLDEYDPQVDTIEHLRQDVPNLYVLGAASLGAFLGKLIGQSNEAQALGALVGAIIGANNVAKAKKDDQKRRALLK